MNWIYLAASLAGVALLVGFNALLTRGRPREISKAAVSARLAAEVPGFRQGLLTIVGREAALCENAADGSFYLAVLHGDALTTRKLTRDCVSARAGAAVAIRFRDFTFPHAHLAFDDEETAAEWIDRLARRGT